MVAFIEKMKNERNYDYSLACSILKSKVKIMKSLRSKLRVNLPILVATVLLLFYNITVCAQDTLYYNNFETPKSGKTPTETSSESYRDLDSRTVDELFGGTGIGNMYFRQTFTIETILNQGNGNNPEVYSNSGIGGKYSLGMQSGNQLSTGGDGENDVLAIKLQAGVRPFINVRLDLSSIALYNKSGSHQFTNPSGSAPQLRVRLYEAVGWTPTSEVFTNNTTTGQTRPGVLGAKIGNDIIINGHSASSNRYAFNWRSVVFSFDLASIPTSTNPNKKVIMLLDALNEQYVAFDNLLITADQTSMPVTYDKVNATISRGTIRVNWTTLGETNNSHFDIMASTDGAHFKKIGRVNTKALNGNSGSQINYDFSTPLGTTGLLAMSFALLGLFVFEKNRNLAIILLILAMSSIVVSCTKSESALPVDTDKRIFVKVVQVDIDGTSASSSVVQAVHE